MQHKTGELLGRCLLSVSAIATAVSAFVFDWSGSHLFNPTWPNHAHFHDAQTMFLGLGLALLTLLLSWRKPVLILAAWLAASLYWLAFLCAAISPRTSFDDPGYRIPHPGGVPANLWFGLAMLAIASIGAWIAGASRSRDARQDIH